MSDGDSQKDDLKIVVGEVGKSKLKRKTWVLTSLGAVIVVAIVIVAIVYLGGGHKNGSTNVAQNAECSEDGHSTLLKQAAQSLNAINVAQLKTVADKVQAIPNFQKDPNCLYVVTAYYVYADNMNMATKYMSELQDVYSSKRGLSPYFNGTVSIENLQSTIAATVQTQNLNSQSDSIYSSGKP